MIASICRSPFSSFSLASWLPVSRALHSPEVDAVDQHRELRRVQLRSIMGIRQMDLKSPAVQALVPEHHAAFLERQNLRAIPAPRYEDVKMPAVRIFARCRHQRRKAVETFAH